MLEKVKIALRFKNTTQNTDLDQEITDNINACLFDLKRVGILALFAVETTQDPLIIQAVKFYCKAQADFDGKGDVWQKKYEDLRDAMALGGDYTEITE